MYTHGAVNVSHVHSTVITTMCLLTSFGKVHSKYHAVSLSVHRFPIVEPGNAACTGPQTLQATTSWKHAMSLSFHMQIS